MEEKGSSSSNSRWNPTKEQIAILEALYMQGIRTPSTEQIQQITIKLREFGMTEGKNVFYWFQNHKARQRQKLKQERFAYYNKLLNPGVSIPAPHPQNAPALHHPQGSNNVVCVPYFAFYQPQHPNMFMPRPMQINPVQDQFQRMELHEYNSNTHEQKNCLEAYNSNDNGIHANDNIETLQLFPLNPTGISEVENSESLLTCASTDNSDPSQVDDYEVGCENNNNDSPTFFNFFG